MQIEITERKKVPLLSRERIIVMATYDGATPSRQALLKEIAQKLQMSEKQVIIKHVYTRFGSLNAKIIVHAYDKIEHVAEIEEKHIVKRHVKEQPKASA